MISATLLDEMRRISTLLQAGAIRVAHDRLERVVADNPGFVEALRLLAGTRQMLGETAEAERLLRRALALEPDWIPTYVTLGELLLASGRGNEAAPLLERAAIGPPPNAGAALLLARHYNDERQPASALAVTAPLCANGIADPDLVAQHVAALAALGRHQEAVAGFRHSVAAEPDDPRAAQALAMALDAANEHVEAEQLASRVLARGCRTAAMYQIHARSLIALGQFERAEAALRDCLHLQPRLVDAHSHLARLVWMRTGDSAQATAVLDAALQAFDDDALRAAKAAVLQGAGDARAAYACLAPAAARAQTPPALLVRAGLAAMEFDPATALDLAERALRAAPHSVPARKLVVAAGLGVGDATGALRHCEALLAETPDDQYLIALQTTAWRLLGDARYAELCNYPQFVVASLLQAPAPWPDLRSFLADLKRSLDGLHDPHGHPLLFQSLRHGTETTQDLTRSTDPAIQALFKAFAPPIDDYLARIGAGSDPLRRRNRGSWRFNGSWSVRLRSFGYHNNHVHPRGWISSACYIELPDNMAEARSREGILTFGEPGIVTAPPLPAEHSVRPEVGMLVLFPSYFWHGTVPITGNHARLTVAFDVVPGSQG